MNKIMAMLAAFCVAGAAFAIETVTSNDVTYARHGSIDQRNQMVVTYVDTGKFAATNNVVKSVNGKRGDITLTANDVGAISTNSSINIEKNDRYTYLRDGVVDVKRGQCCSGMDGQKIFLGRRDNGDYLEIYPYFMIQQTNNVGRSFCYPKTSGILITDKDLDAATNAIDVTGQIAPLSNELQMVKGEVITIANTINGASGRLEVTNYDSQVHAPSLKIQYSLDQNVWKTAWDENTRLNPLEEGLLDMSFYMTNFPFGLCSSLTGTPSPTGLLQVSHPVIQLGDRLEWHKSVTVNNSIYILSSTSPTFVFSNSNTNQDFCVRDQFGDDVFKIERGEDKVVGASCNTFNRIGPNSWYIGCNISNDVQMASALTIWASTSIEKSKEDWREMGNGLANITRHDPIDRGEYKEYGFTIDVYAVSSKMFFAANYKSTGKNQVTVGIPFNIQKINIGNKTYRVEPKTINGELVLGLTEVVQ